MPSDKAAVQLFIAITCCLIPADNEALQRGSLGASNMGKPT